MIEPNKPVNRDTLKELIKDLYHQEGESFESQESSPDSSEREDKNRRELLLKSRQKHRGGNRIKKRKKVQKK